MNAIIDKGLAILLPKVATMKQVIQARISKLLERHDYQPVCTPHIGDITLFETSGHYPFYKKDMFSPIGEISDSEGPVGDLDYYLLKPMNCPFHITAYASEPRSYKELPVRYYEFGTVYRYEKSGALNGLFRLRGFTQDDGHIFCTMEQIEAEIRTCISLVTNLMKMFNLTVSYKLSLRTVDASDKYVGDPADWDESERILTEIINTATTGKYEVEQGGAAFYGPKIDFVAKDMLQREWQLGTIQLDFNLPTKFKLQYRDSDNQGKTPVLIHRALLGSLERFIAILLEQPKLPLWLELEQVRVIPVHKDQLDYAIHVYRSLKNVDIRAKLDAEEAPLSAKIKNAITDKVPIRLIVGKTEEADNLVTVNDHLGKFTTGLNAFINNFNSAYDII